MIKVIELSNVSAQTNDAGDIRITGTKTEQSLFSAAATVASMPLAFSDEENFVSKGTAATASIVWGVLGFHLCDFIQADNKEDALSPITGLLLG
jgi:hypothetical protein